LLSKATYFNENYNAGITHSMLSSVFLRI